MPIGTLARTETDLTFTVQGLSGDIARVSVSGLTSAPSGAAVDNLRAAIAAATNAALVSQFLNAQAIYAVGSVNDDAYSAVQTKMVLIFQDATTGNTRRFELPAPDATLFGADGNTVDRNNGLVTDLIAAIQTIIGAEYELRRGFLTSRTRRTRTSNLNLYGDAVEPAAPVEGSGPGEPA